MNSSSDLNPSAADDLIDDDEGGAREILTFRLGAETFGIRVAHVREVLDYKPISRVSNAPSSLLGMIDVRGIGVPVVDLKMKLRMPMSFGGDPTPDTRIVVLDFTCGSRKHTVAMIADAVHEVMELGDGEIESPPQFGESWNSGFMTGLGRRGEDFLTLLDMPALFEADAFDFAA